MHNIMKINVWAEPYVNLLLGETPPPKKLNSFKPVHTSNQLTKDKSGIFKAAKP